MKEFKYSQYVFFDPCLIFWVYLNVLDLSEEHKYNPKMKPKEAEEMPMHTDDFKGFLDWKCTNCGKMFHQQFDCDVPQCSECVNKAWEKKRKKGYEL